MINKKYKEYNMLIKAGVLAILIGIIGYLLYQNKYSSTISVQKEVRKLEKQSSSNEVSAIEKDLNDTNLSNLDTELNDIEKELNQY